MILEPGDPQRVADLIDLHDGRLGVPLLDDAGIRRLLTETRRIAVVGASADPLRPSHGVVRDLLALGYEVVPVNPSVEEIQGLRCHPDLEAAVAATGPVDIVDVFRRAEACPPHAREAVAVKARCLWLQLGIASREAGEIATAGGLEVVMDRCLAVEARRR
jgi:predicted CoA-binding protein